MEEIWKPVALYNGEFKERYLVSNMGRVKGLYFNKILSIKGTDSKGYLQFVMYSPTSVKTVKLHRAVKETFHPRPEHAVIDHVDGDKTNNKLENLVYETNHYNVDKSQGRKINIDGEVLTINQAILKYGGKGVHNMAVKRRIDRYGWAAKDAVTTPILRTGQGVGQA